MTSKRCSQPTSNVVQLSLNHDYQPAIAASNPGAESGYSPLAALECLFGNPKFATPANDDIGTEKLQQDALAPVHRSCREARLIRLWVETLAGINSESA